MPRPQLSISPGPQLKRQPDKQRRKYVCEPLSYRRHIEQHIERVFKYLKDRQKRLDECESAIHAELKPKDEESIRKMLALKETRYLRSLRTRLSSKDFQEIQRLGEGFIGKVSLVEKVDTKNLYAMKKMRKSQVILQNHMAHVMAERDILAEADNEWIVKLYYSFQDEHYLFFILEYCPGGDMMNLLINKRVFPENWARFYIAEISLALQFVHDMRFIHRDIKPDNILIDAKGHIKLADFGLCTGFRWTHDLKYYRDETLNNLNNNNMNTNGNNLHGGGLSILGSHQDQSDDHPTITKALTRREMEYSLKRRSLSLVGSPNYIAPEVLRRDSTNERLCDWWSVGVILYEMVIGFCPFIDVEAVSNNRYNPMLDTAEKIQQRIVEWRRYLVFTSNNDPKSPNLMPDVHGNLYEPSEAVKSLIRGWICDPHERLCQNGIADIKSHPFFKGFDWDRIRMMEAPFVPELRNSHDTSHFDPAAQGQQNNEHGTLGANINRQLAMNHFTYRAFWNKPLSGGLL